VRGVDCCEGFFEGRGHCERDARVVARVFWEGRRLFRGWYNGGKAYCVVCDSLLELVEMRW
jgi:hypothetical protein